jgi:GNAT superfamily N-acetyltransferase
VSSYRIVTARPRDLARISEIELAAATLLRGYAPESVLTEVTGMHELRAAQRDRRLWVALADRLPVGFAHVERREPDSAHLEEVDVHPLHGRRGLGTRLVQTICNWASQRAYRSVTLTTFRDVPWNMPFYLRLGFKEIPEPLLTPALRVILEDEARRGLAAARRVAMCYQVPQRA